MKAKRLTSSHWQQRPTCPLKPAPSSIPWPSPPKLEAVLQRLLPSIPPIPQPFEAHFPRRYPPSQHTARGASSTRPSISGPPMTSPSSLQARLVTAAPPSLLGPPRPGSSVSKIHRVAGISGGSDEAPEQNCISARGGTGLNSSSLGPLTF